jgi:hypothetical protein
VLGVGKIERNDISYSHKQKSPIQFTKRCATARPGLKSEVQDFDRDTAERFAMGIVERVGLHAYNMTEQTSWIGSLSSATAIPEVS